MDEPQGLFSQEQIKQPAGRPSILTVLCILSFINAGITAFSSLFIAAFFNQVVEVVNEIAEKFKYPGMDVFIEIFNASSPGYYLINALLCAGSFTGALMMWRLRKKGFHIYTISQILLILSPMYFFHLPGPSILEVMLTGTFVALYGSQLKLMK